MRRTVVGGLAIGLALLVAGCAEKLKSDVAFSVEPGLVKSFEIPKPSVKRKVKITVTATGAPVSVYVVLQKDADAAMKDIQDRNKAPASTLAMQEKTESATFDIEQPVNEELAVIVSSTGKAASGNVKISS